MLSKSEIAHIRKEYCQQTLSEQNIEKSPVKQFEKWWNQAVSSEIDEVNAMTLATSDSKNTPSARIVLLKAFNDKGFVFFTNYISKKGQAIKENPKACLLFFWKEFERQIRIEGNIEKVSEDDSDEYFDSRPYESKLGAWSSPQSEIVADRKVIEDNVSRYRNQFSDGSVPRPPFWGGYILKPELFEFWQGRPSRLHDRIQYTMIGKNNWRIDRLAP